MLYRRRLLHGLYSLTTRFFYTFNASITQIRYPLKREVVRQITAKAKRRAPEMTTKHGKLRADRKGNMQRIYLDDLAQLENFTIVMTFSKNIVSQVISCSTTAGQLVLITFMSNGIIRSVTEM